MSHKDSEHIQGSAHKLACSDRRVARVVSYIARDLSRRVPLVLAAQIAGLETRYFSKRFHRTVGISFAEWNARTRMEEAKRLLEIDDLSITAIAASVGYVDLTTFARAFRRCEQRCPREYRRLLVSGQWERQQTPKARQQTPRKQNGESPIIQRQPSWLSQKQVDA